LAFAPFLNFSAGRSPCSRRMLDSRRRGSDSETQGPPPRDWPREAREETSGALLSSNRRSGAAFLGHDRLALPVPLNPGEREAVMEEPPPYGRLVLAFFVDEGSHGVQGGSDL